MLLTIDLHNYFFSNGARPRGISTEKAMHHSNKLAYRPSPSRAKGGLARPPGFSKITFLLVLSETQASVYP